MIIVAESDSLSNESI